MLWGEKYLEIAFYDFRFPFQKYFYCSEVSRFWYNNKRRSRKTNNFGHVNLVFIGTLNQLLGEWFSSQISNKITHFAPFEIVCWLEIEKLSQNHHRRCIDDDVRIYPVGYKLPTNLSQESSQKTSYLRAMQRRLLPSFYCFLLHERVFEFNFFYNS